MASSDTTAEWEVHWCILPKRLIDGRRSDISELLACRKVNGAWQYRMPTLRELQEHFRDQW